MRDMWGGDIVFFFKQKTAYEIKECDWSSDVCSSDLYHPAALLRNPQWKRPTWEDVQFLRKLYDEEIQYGTNAKKL